MKKSNDQQYAKARKDYGKDFFAKTGSSSDSGLKKGATTMDKDAVKVGRFATGGAMRQPRDGSMRFQKGGSVDRSEDIELTGVELDKMMGGKSHPKEMKRVDRAEAAGSADYSQTKRGKPMRVARDAGDVMLGWRYDTEDGRPGRVGDVDKKGYRRGGKVPPAFAKKPKPEDAMAMAEEKTMTKGFPRNKAAKFATGGAAKPVKRNMGGMMGGPLAALPNPPAGMRAGPGDPAGAMGRMFGPRPGGIGAPGGNMAPPSPMMESPQPMQGGEGGQFRKGGAVKPVKLGSKPAR